MKQKINVIYETMLDDQLIKLINSGYFIDVVCQLTSTDLSPSKVMIIYHKI